MPVVFHRWLALGLLMMPTLALAWSECLETSAAATRFSCLSRFEVENSGDLAFELALSEAAGKAGEYAYAAVVLDRLVRNHPDQAGARLDLVILSLEAGDTLTAAEHLNYLLTLPDPPPKAAQLIQLLDQRLNPSQHQDRFRDPLRFRARVGLGFDDNPNLGLQASAIDLIIDGVPVSLQPDNSLKPEPRAYGGLGFDLDYRLNGRQRVVAALSARQYEGETDQDTLASVAVWEQKLVEGRYLAMSVSDFRMRDGLYLSRLGVSGRQILGRCHCYSIGAGVDIMDGSEASYRSARGKLNVEAVKSIGDVSVLAYGAFAYHRQPDAVWGDTLSIQLGADAVVDIAGGSLAIGASRYDSFDEDQYSPLFGDGRRDLIRNQVKLGYAMGLSPGLELYIDWSYVDQDSDIPLYSYNRYVGELGARLTF